jgi:hypothetical protein
MSKDKKETKEKVSKTEFELRELHASKIDHAVQSIEKWTGKLGKAMKSRKYPLADDQTAQILDYLEKVRQSFVDSLTAPEKAQKPGFKLK